ncbi:MAG: hypothetical protein HY849_10860 [Nitrosomonadales bacterium]|nr:hypothetical protein [Nitrosomonadales bacterium]
MEFVLIDTGTVHPKCLALLLGGILAEQPFTKQARNRFVVFVQHIKYFI